MVLSWDGTLESLEMLKNSQLWGLEILAGGSAVLGRVWEAPLG